MTIALTGATGQLGRLVVDELLAVGHPPEGLLAILRNPGKASDLVEKGVQVRQADYADPSAWPAALEGVDRLLLISVSGAGASTAHRSVIDAAALVGVGHIAYTSIINADRSTNPLAGEHHATERLIAATGIPAAFLRNAWYHELYTSQLSSYLTTGEVVGSTGDGRVSGAARADFAAAAAAVLRSDDEQSHTYELGGPAFTLAGLAETIASVTGTKVANRNLTDDEYTAQLRAAGMDPTSIGFVVGTDASIRGGEMETDSGDLARLIGRATISLADSVRNALR